MSQSLSDILLHIIFSTKDRCPIILPDIEEELYRYISSITVSHDCPVIKIGGVSDHLHMLISFGRTVSISKLITEIKANSSRWIKTKDVKYSTFSWQRGYGAFSVARRNLDSVIKYINNQKEHHQKVSFKDEFLALLQQSKIKFDEKYLWD